MPPRGQLLPASPNRCAKRTVCMAHAILYAVPTTSLRHNVRPVHPYKSRGHATRRSTHEALLRPCSTCSIMWYPTNPCFKPWVSRRHRSLKTGGGLQGLVDLVVLHGGMAGQLALGGIRGEAKALGSQPWSKPHSCSMQEIREEPPLASPNTHATLHSRT